MTSKGLRCLKAVEAVLYGLCKQWTLLSSFCCIINSFEYSTLKEYVQGAKSVAHNDDLVQAFVFAHADDIALHYVIKVF